MERLNIFIGFLLFLLLILLWFCFVFGNNAEKYKHELKKLQRKFDEQARELNTLTLWYKAYQEALNVDNIEGKH